MSLLGILPTSLSMCSGQLVYCHKCCKYISVDTKRPLLLILSAIEYHVMWICYVYLFYVDYCVYAIPICLLIDIQAIFYFIPF